MTLPSMDHLDELSRADLLALVKELIAAVQRLEAENQQLKAEATRRPPPTATSRNSSQPPSCDAKSNRPAGRKRKKQGPPFGHERKTRLMMDQPDRIIEAAVEWCQHCQADLHGVEPRAVVRHQLTELPPVTRVVIETRQHEVVWPDW